MATKPLLTDNLNSYVESECFDVHVLDQTGSTNDDAFSFLAHENEKKYCLVTARRQRTGKGTRGRSFASPKDTGIYMSLGFYMSADTILAQNLITPAAAVAVYDAVEQIAGVKPGIKWVNDLYLGGKKLCGILAERKLIKKKPCCVIGIGVNIVPFALPQDAGFAPAFLQDFAADIDCEKLCARIAQNLVERIETLPQSGFMETYRQQSILLGKHIEYECDGQRQIAQAVAIDDDGRLIVMQNGQKTTLSSGDVSVRMRQLI